MTLNECRTLADYIEVAIDIYAQSGKQLTIEQAHAEGKRLQRMHNADVLEKAKEAKEYKLMFNN